MIFVDPRTGLTYEAFTSLSTISPCTLCDLQEFCDEQMCRDWRELANISRTHFKEIGQCKQYK